MGFLTEITDRIRRDLERVPIDEGALMARVLASPPPRPFEAALRSGTPSIIAEVKRASPSAGRIADPDPVAQARSYAHGGAAAISVLTEPRHFHGSLTDLRAVRTAVPLPVLRKDFLVSPAQVIEARAAGADAVLLIAASLPGRELDAMLAAATDLGMGALVEAHGDDDLDRAVASRASMIGMNARDLETLEVDVPAALDRLSRVPADRLAVFESGIRSRADVEAAAAAGAAAVLVGEALMRSDDPRSMLIELAGAGKTVA
jgi:indole-3-glycerol phosphate synthase